MVKEIKITTTREKFLKDYLKSLNGILSLTERELMVLVKMLEINVSLTATKEIRKQIVRETSISSVGVLNPIIQSLKDKGILKENPGGKGYLYNDMVIPTSLQVNIKFVV